MSNMFDQNPLLLARGSTPTDANNQNVIKYLPFQFKTELKLVKRDKYPKIIL